MFASPSSPDSRVATVTPRHERWARVIVAPATLIWASLTWASFGSAIAPGTIAWFPVALITAGVAAIALVVTFVVDRVVGGQGGGSLTRFSGHGCCVDHAASSTLV